MKLEIILTTAVVVVAIGLTAVPVDAQQRRGSGNRGGAQTSARESGPQQRAASRPSQPGNSAQQPRSTGQQQRGSVQQPRSYGQQSQGVVQQPRGSAQQPRSTGQQSQGIVQQPRGYAQGAVPQQGRLPGGANRGYQGRVLSGSAYAYSRPGYTVPRGMYGNGYRPYYYSRPYYSFRPRLSIGFGLWLGYPVGYPYYSYGYGTPAYGYAPSAMGITVGAAYGGISFEIDPYDAAIEVDGEYVGTAGNFGPSAQPLTLPVGLHQIRIDAPGYQTIVSDVTVLPGEVIPFRGAMLPS